MKNNTCTVKAIASLIQQFVGNPQITFEFRPSQKMIKILFYEHDQSTNIFHFFSFLDIVAKSYASHYNCFGVF